MSLDNNASFRDGLPYPYLGIWGLPILLCGLSLLLLFAALKFLGLPVEHYPRVLIAELILLGAIVYWWKTRRRFHTRLAELTLAAVLLVLAWWLMPTTRGLNLLTARRLAAEQVANLAGVNSDDVPGFLAGLPARQDLENQFPRLGGKLHQAEEEWLARFLDAVTRGVEAGAYGPGKEALLRLRQLDKELKAFQPPQSRLQAYRHRIGKARLTSARAVYQSVRREARAHLDGDRFQLASQTAVDFVASFRPEAVAAGISEEELLKFRDAYRYVAELAKRAGKPDHR